MLYLILNPSTEQSQAFFNILSRILPNGTTENINNAGIEYYKSLVRELIKNEIIPGVTLFHWDLPQALEDVGGFTNVSLVENLVDYARIVISILPEVQYWITFNEPRIFCAFGYTIGLMAPGKKGNYYQCAYVLLKAHAEIYHMYKKEFLNYNGKIFICILVIEN